MGLLSSSSWSRELRVERGLLEAVRLRRPEPECVPDRTPGLRFAALLKERSQKGPGDTRTSVETVGACLEDALVWEFESLLYHEMALDG